MHSHHPTQGHRVGTVHWAGRRWWCLGRGVGFLEVFGGNTRRDTAAWSVRLFPPHSYTRGSKDRVTGVIICISEPRIVYPRRRRARAASKTRHVCLIHGCGEEDVRYCPLEVARRALLSVLSQVEWHVHEMSLFTVERGSGRGVMFTSVRAILAAAAAISFPLMFLCEGTHWRVTSHPSVMRYTVY